MQEVSISSFLIQVAHRGEKDYFTHFPYHKTEGILLSSICAD